MSRTNWNDKDELDPRFEPLARRLGNDRDRARGRLIRFWMLARKYWGEREKLPIPLDEFDLNEDFAILVETRWARRTDAGVYAGDEKESKARFDWYWKLCENSRNIKENRDREKQARQEQEERERASAAQAAQTSHGSQSDSVRSPSGLHLDVHMDNQAESICRPSLLLTPSSSADNKAKHENSVVVLNAHAHALINDAPPLGDPPDPETPPRLTVDDLVALWNNLRGALAEVRYVSREMRANVQERLAEHPDADFWRRAIPRLAKSKFATGQKPGSDGTLFIANFAWLVANDGNPIKAESGQFDDRQKAVPQRAPPRCTDCRDTGCIEAFDSDDARHPKEHFRCTCAAGKSYVNDLAVPWDEPTHGKIWKRRKWAQEED